MSITLKDIKGCAFLVLFSVITAFLFNHFSPHGIALFGQWETGKGVVTAHAKDKPIDMTIEINDPNTVLQIVQQKERVVLDVRHKDFYEMGHLPGALSFPLSDYDQYLDTFLKTMKKDTKLLVYCSGFDCETSHTFANRLVALNYTDVKVFPGGFGQWQEMGFEIEKNDE